MRGLIVLATLPLLLGLGGCSGQLLKTAQVMDLDSSLHINPTGSFTVAAAWDLKYTYDCSSQHSQGLLKANKATVIVYNSDDDSLNAEHPRVTAQGLSGGATVHFKRGGTFYAEVDTVCSWRVVVIDLNGA